MQGQPWASSGWPSHSSSSGSCSARRSSCSKVIVAMTVLFMLFVAAQCDWVTTRMATSGSALTAAPAAAAAARTLRPAAAAEG
eukprot:12786316-Alexandrium_andersonii.AAC.1